MLQNRIFIFWKVVIYGDFTDLFQWLKCTVGVKRLVEEEKVKRDGYTFSINASLLERKERILIAFFDRRDVCLVIDISSQL